MHFCRTNLIDRKCGKVDKNCESANQTDCHLLQVCIFEDVPSAAFILSSVTINTGSSCVRFLSDLNETDANTVIVAFWCRIIIQIINTHVNGRQILTAEKSDCLEIPTEAGIRTVFPLTAKSPRVYKPFINGSLIWSQALINITGNVLWSQATIGYTCWR